MKYYKLSDDRNTILDLDEIIVLAEKDLTSFSVVIDSTVVDLEYMNPGNHLAIEDYDFVKDYVLSRRGSGTPASLSGEVTAV